ARTCRRGGAAGAWEHARSASTLAARATSSGGRLWTSIAWSCARSSRVSLRCWWCGRSSRPGAGAAEKRVLLDEHVPGHCLLAHGGDFQAQDYELYRVHPASLTSSSVRGRTSLRRPN